MAGEESYQFGPFHLDVTRRRLSNGGQRVQLTPKALDTLVALVRHAGSTLEKDELLKEVWADTFVEEATLAQNITALRRALGETPDDPTYIATVPRRGYRFIAPVQRQAGGAVPDAQAAGAPAPPASPHPTSALRRPRTWVAAAIVLLICVAWLPLRRRASAGFRSPPVRFVIAPPDGTRFSTRGGFMAISPSGRHIAFITERADHVPTIWLRALDALDARPLSGTEGASQVFWSPGGEQIAFFADGRLKRVAIAGGSVDIICDVPKESEPLAGTWNASGEIVFSEVRQQLYRVNASGGAAAALQMYGLTPDDSAAWPRFLPDGQRFIYVVQSREGGHAGLYVGSLDGTSRRIADIASSTVPVPGYLLYVEQGMLRAQPFDAASARLTGAPSTLAYRVAFNPGTLRGVFTASQNGVVAFRTVDQAQLTWVKRNGDLAGKLGEVAAYLDFSISPDGREVAASVLDAASGNADIRILNADGSIRRLTADPALNIAPLWSRDGSQVLFTSGRPGNWRIARRRAHAPGAEERILESATHPSPRDWLPTGQLLYSVAQDVQDLHLLGSDLNRRPFFHDPDGIGSARVSPDGRWLAYEAHPARSAIVVRSIQGPDRRLEVSAGEGTDPRWRQDGKEIYYLASDLAIMVAPLTEGAEVGVGAATVLFRPSLVSPSGIEGAAYDAAPDGQSFLVKVPVSHSPIVVIANWASN